MVAVSKKALFGVVAVAAVAAAFLMNCGGVGAIGGGGERRAGFQSVRTPATELEEIKRSLEDRMIPGGIGIGESNNLQVARRVAEDQARAELATSMGAQVQRLSESYAQNVSNEARTIWEEGVRQLTNERLQGTRAFKTLTEQNPENGHYRVYTLMILDPAIFRAAMAAQQARQEEFELRVKKDDMMARLDANISAYQRSRECGCVAGCEMEPMPAHPDPAAGGGTLENLPFRSGAIPAGASIFIEEIQMNDVVISGGSATVGITTSKPLDELYVQTGDESGYYVLSGERLTLASSSDSSYSYTALLQFTQNLNDGRMTINMSGYSAACGLSPTVVKDVETKRVGLGYFQISLSWDNYDDIDLHVTVPSGGEIFWSNKTVGNGKLDLDALGCNGHVRNENIFFTAPLVDGEYTVEVVQYSRCSGTTGAAYSVTSRVGGELFVFSDNQQGRFTSSGRIRNLIGKIQVRDGTVVRP